MTSDRSGGWSRVPAHRQVTVRDLHCIVDGFKYAGSHCSTYFLTHFHADHYDGLSETFSHGLIHCSLITASLLPTLGISQSLICPHPYDEPFVLDGVQVTLVEANHCPGAVLILFQPLLPSSDAPPDPDVDLSSPAKRRKVDPLHPQLSGEGTLLHTGDFRWDEAMKGHPCLRSFRPDTLYLDTTYSSPSFCFPLQSASITHLLHCLLPHLSSPSTLFLFSTYVIGKERIFHALVQALHCRLYVPPRKLRLLQLMRNPYLSAFTSDPALTRFHVGGWAQLGETWPFFKANFRNADIYLRQVNDGQLQAAHAQEDEGDDGLVHLPSSPPASSPAPTRSASLYDGEGVGADAFKFITDEHRRLAQLTSPTYTAVVGFVPTGWVHSKSVAFPPAIRRKVDGGPFDGGRRRRSQKAKAAEAEAKSIRKLLPDPTTTRDTNGPSPDEASAMEGGEAEQEAEAGEGREGGGGLPPHVVYLVPYSEHSSFAELQSCVKFFRPRLIVPTVFSDAKHSQKIIALFRNAVDRTANVRTFLQHFGATPTVDAPLPREAVTTAMEKAVERREEAKRAAVEVISLDDDPDDDSPVVEKTGVNSASLPSVLGRGETAVTHFCHECRHRWTAASDEQSSIRPLLCPRCASTFVEEQQEGYREAVSSPVSALVSAASPTRSGGGSAGKSPHSSPPLVKLEKVERKGSGKQLSLAAFFHK